MKLFFQKNNKLVLGFTDIELRSQLLIWMEELTVLVVGWRGSLGVPLTRMDTSMTFLKKI